MLLRYEALFFAFHTSSVSVQPQEVEKKYASIGFPSLSIIIPLDDLNVKRWKERKIKTWYYTTNLHKGAFMLPKYVEDMLEEEEK